MAFEVRLLRRENDRSGFACGEEPVNTFLQRFAHHHQFKHGVSGTWVAVEDGRVGAFVTLTATTLGREEVPSTRSLSPFPLPALLLARLGVARTAQGSGVGKQLLLATARTAVRMRADVGCVGIAVDAKPNAVRFYARRAFAVIRPPAEPGASTRMFLPMETIDGAVS